LSLFVPNDLRLALWLAAIPVGVLVLGYALLRTAPRSARAGVLAWLVVGTVAVERLAAGEPAGVRMLALIAFMMSSLKVLVTLNERARGMAPLGFGAWLGFAAGWLGMQPRLFSQRADRPLAGASALLGRGALHVALGVAVIALARSLATTQTTAWLAPAWFLVGTSLVLHFGICHLLAGTWRLAGVPCEPLFRAPLRSESLSEFWARRWNLAFSELTASVVYRPLASRLGKSTALMASFLWSGLLHEVAVSLPVNGGYGLPTLYFLLHAGLVWIERALARAGRPLSGWIGRTWTLFWLALPLPWLAHEAFIGRFVLPLLGVTPR
jgi:hypothetical protein